MALHVLGVRHHSPACARRVDHAIRALRPRHVLIEGPSDFNGRIWELVRPWEGRGPDVPAEGHQLPVALFTWYRSEERTYSCWTPFCRHSPEWLALTTGAEVGAQVRFMDLPAWHKTFSGVRNRYADVRDRSGDYIARLCEKLAVDDLDTLWDHLFEQPMPPEVLGERLDQYFRSLRADAPASDRDGPREAYMARCIAWALRDCAEHGGDVVAVCGGWHQPPLEEVTAGEETVFPVIPPLEETDARQNSYLVPYSFRRLDSFVGYESGMPSPGWYDAVWGHGPEKAADQLLIEVVKALRGRKQLVSTADLIACMSSASGLARLRGHDFMTRTDLLDGIAVALVKDGMEVPLPWSRRGTLAPRTDPLLVEVVRIFSGSQEGRLAPGTPRPPLLFDVEEQLRTADLEAPRVARDVHFDLVRADHRDKSRLLHRLRILKIPGFVRTHGPKTAVDDDLGETWRLQREDHAESALIEASAWGGTLEAAAARCLEESLLAAQGLKEKAALLGDAVFVGVDGLALRVLDDVARGIQSEPDFGVIGGAMSQVLGVWRHGKLLGAAGSAQLGIVLEACFDRGLWLAEGIMGATAPASDAMVEGMLALRDTARFGSGRFGQSLNLPFARAQGVMQRRAVDEEAPPAIRGAALGFLWNFDEWPEPGQAESHASAAIRAAARPETLGDFLAGLFALAREEVMSAPSLLAVVDGLFREMDGHGFLVGLPALRLAFGYFPPRERRRIAEAVAKIHGGDAAAARSLLTLAVSPQEIARGAQIDGTATRKAARFGLGDEQELA